MWRHVWVGLRPSDVIPPGGRWDARSPGLCGALARERCGNCLLEIRSCENSLSPFSNEFPPTPQTPTVERILGFDIARGEPVRRGGVDSPPNGERRSGFISVHGSRAAGNSFLSPRGRSARFGPVSAQCVLKETRCSLRGVRVPLVVFIHICIRLLFGSINTSIVHNDQFEDIRLAHAACASWQGVVAALVVEVVESSSSSRN